MANIAKIDTVEMANIAKIYGVDIANIASMYGMTTAVPAGNYFGDGSDGELSTDGNVTHTVLNKSGSYSGDMYVANYTSLTINSGHTITTDQPCKGMIVYVWGDCVIDGTLTMTARGALVNPTSAGVSATGIRLPVLTSAGSDTLANADFAGCGTSATTAVANHPDISGNGDIFVIDRTGSSGGDAAIVVSEGQQTGNIGSTGAQKSGGGGSGGVWHANAGTGTSGKGTSGTCFAGGSAGGGSSGKDGSTTAQDAALYAGKGGNAARSHTYGAGAGAGNPGGTGAGGSDGADGTGGLLVLIVSGNLTIGASGLISANGSSGAVGPQSGGGGSGGGNILVLYAGTLSNSGTIQASGGIGGVIGGYTSHGGDGGAGNVQGPTQITAATSSYATPAERWAAWDESSEPSLASPNTFVAMMENVSASSNETGEGGGLSGADLVGTQTGTIAGATGSPIYRVLDGTNDYFSFTQNMIETMLNNQSEWTMMWKIDITTLSQINPLMRARRSAAPAYGVDVYINASNKLYVQCAANGSTPNLLNAGTTDSITTGVQYVVVWFDGTYVKAGFSSTRPTKLSDFDSTKQISNTTSTQFNCIFTNAPVVGLTDGAYFDGKLYYFLMSNQSLIDNRSDEQIAWADWDESSQSGLSSTDTFVVLLDDVSASSNETGEGGGLSGADLVLTQYGSVAGATGSPPTRALPSSDGFTVTQGLIAMLHGATEFTLIWKVKRNSGWASGNPSLGEMDCGDRLNVQWYVGNFDIHMGAQYIAYNAGGPVDNGIDGDTYYICIWQDSLSGSLRFGYTLNMMPTYSSDMTGKVNFPSTMTLTENGALANDEIFGNPSHVAGFKCDAYYAVMSKACLIVNND